jgi:cobalamin biosynthetic protein CobC
MTFPFDAPMATPLMHGGDLAAARRMFPGAPEPFVDLSTGINPHHYPIPQLPTEAFTRLSDQTAVDRLASIAAKAYGVPSAVHVVPAPGTQILLPLVAALASRGRAAVLGPTYAEHRRVAALVGHAVTAVTDIEHIQDVDLAIVVNPNNPDGRILTKLKLLALADRLRSRGGLLVVDEAFMDVAQPGASLAAEVDCGNVVVLRSFGKFFGLAGLRLGFALAAPVLAVRISATLGPWAVAGPAITIGQCALADTSWGEATRISLSKSATQLDQLLIEAGLDIVGGTTLFRLVHTALATQIFQHLGRCGILVRRFTDQPTWLRFGLPGSESEWQRLRSGLRSAR